MLFSRPLALAALLVTLPACGFALGPDPVDDTAAADPVDLLFVVDNSDSMQLHATELAHSLELLEASLADAGVTEWRAGITTSSVYYDDGPTSGIDPGEAGTLIGGATVDTVEALRTDLLCKATCWDQDMPADPAYVCGDAAPDEPSEEYLDCECGVGAWQGNCGTGQEQPLEAAFLAMCRAVESPPAECSVFPDGAAAVFGSGDEHSNAGLGDRATFVLLVTDEGDSSLRTESGDAAVPGDVETVVSAYTSLFAGFPDTVRVSAIGPAWDGSDGSCLLGAAEWGVDRFFGVVENTGGVYEPLTDLGADCAGLPMEHIVATMAAAAGE
jgi:hypothetical protein